MNSDRIANRITDLLKLTGVSDKHAIEELTDHYLTHIEEEIERGVNSQKAVRETYQEIANLDTSHFAEEKKKKSKKGWLALFALGALLSILFWQIGTRSSDASQNTMYKKELAHTAPPAGSPIANHDLDVSSGFGMRLNPINKVKALHKGIDIRAKLGTPVVSTGDGVVKEAGYKPKAGNYITIQHGGNYITNYFHLSEIQVESCQKVKAGQVIGKVGNSGMTMGTHLHYEVLKDKVPVNPLTYILP